MNHGPRFRSALLIALGTFALSGCAQHRQGAATTATQSIAVSTPNASFDPGAVAHPDAIFSSKTTGRVRLNDIRGNGHQCSAAKLFIGLADRSDLPMFVKLIQTHQVLDSVMIDDPTSGHQIYKLRGVVATGKSAGPLITLEFATMNVTGCPPR